MKQLITTLALLISAPLYSAAVAPAQTEAASKHEATTSSKAVSFHYDELKYEKNRRLRIFLNETPIGVLRWQPIENNECELYHFFVSKKHRGCGYGTLLLNEICTFLGNLGHNNAVLYPEPFEEGETYINGPEKPVNTINDPEAIEKLQKFYGENKFVPTKDINNEFCMVRTLTKENTPKQAIAAAH